MEQARDILQRHFGYDDFRIGQAELIGAILSGRDCVGVMPTGAGKSICYQIPALMLPGFTLVISPLVSLMHDQVSALASVDIPAAYLNSQLAHYERERVMDRAAAGELKLLYIAPERLDDAAFRAFAAAASISLVAVDEAHCVSQWGQDFRPSYLGIAEFIDGLPTRPTVAAFTATATQRVADDIARLLALRDPYTLTTGFDRPNLRFEVEQLNDKRKGARLLEVVRANPADSGIVYCATRKSVEGVHEFLVRAGVNATRYHAGLDKAERIANQRAFVNDDAPVIVATNAFGMGIDKSNVRYVVHYNMPGSLEAYYQEAGRAGRDGQPATCLLMWNDSDIATARYFIEEDSGNEALTPEEAAAVLAGQRRRLAAMTGYCLTTDCLRATILAYFGEMTVTGFVSSQVSGQSSIDGNDNALTWDDTNPVTVISCDNCSNCDDDATAGAIDVTLTARAVMRCVQELRGRFGKGIVADVLTGSKSAKVREWGLDRKRTYGTVDESAGTVKEIIELLTAGGYLDITEGRYPLVGFGPRYREAATDEFRLYMKRKARPAKAKAAGSTKLADPAKSAGQGSSALETEEQRELFERLRALRKTIATEDGVPPYVVFSDAALRGMCLTMPATDDDFLAIPGVGPKKLKSYGKTFLSEIASFKSQTTPNV